MVKIEEGVRNGFFYILFQASMIKIFTVQLQNVSLNLNPRLVQTPAF